ncbi:MAG TPA: glucose-6-phosphate isomerase [Verrucomicrobiae bacterium]
MRYTNEQLWERFQKYYTEFPEIGLALDLSRMNFPDDFFTQMDAPIKKAFAAMKELEAGAIANPDEKRMVGHYWLRNPQLAPTSEIREEIEKTLAAIIAFAKDVHRGVVKGSGGKFKNLLLIGIGGSALGPQFVASALTRPGKDKLRPFFSDNTDPDGMDKVLGQIGSKLGQTLVVVISKSGGTKETRNGMLEAKAAYENAGLKFEQHAVAVTGVTSELDQYAESNMWMRRFPMWDWVGGRTSELSAVGLLPAALQGFKIERMLAGAKACDVITRRTNVNTNPAAQLALMWYYSGNGKGSKDMVVLPYKDRLELFSKYLQQLIMESLGKEFDLNGNLVNQGMAVYGNKGSTDQHAYVQQLIDGIHNFFVTFIQVLKDRETHKDIAVEPNTTSGDYLNGFFLGTRSALYENDRESISITIDEVSPFSMGVLMGLYERAVGFYATLVNINAYHQPGVEAGKLAAGAILEVQNRVQLYLAEKRGHAMTPAQIASGVGAHGDYEIVFKILEHLAANPTRGIVKRRGKTPFDATFTAT